ncbi:MAG: hypothetical protein CVV53_09095, partial [Spirochaetae bacterium HGW-Spirochaetae-9]
MNQKAGSEQAYRYSTRIGIYRYRLLAFALLLVVLAVVALLAGRYPSAGIANPLHLLEDALFAKVVLNVRLPR